MIYAPLYALLLFAGAFSALFISTPEYANMLKGSLTLLLSLVMFSMGTTLAFEDFKRIFKRPFPIAIGVAMQYGIMPFLALGISLLFGFDAMTTLGMVLVGCVPGGTASNLIAFLAKADVALSISLTAISTLLSIVATPFLIYLLSGSEVHFDPLTMVWSIVKIVFLPVLLGLLIGAFFKGAKPFFENAASYASAFVIALIIGIILGLNHERLDAFFSLIFLAVIIHNGLGFGIGYGVARWIGYEPKIARTLAIEVGMQNSGLAVILATKFFTPTVAIAGALFSLWHNLSGIIAARIWRGQDA